mgnify:CR=1 FL=1
MAYDLSVHHYICSTDVPFPAFAGMVRDVGIGSVVVTRAALAEMGVPALARCLKDHGLGVSSLASAGYLTGTQPEAKAGFSDSEMNDIAAELGTVNPTVISGVAGPAARGAAARRPPATA